ncbi:MAG: DUF4254 domain-containing protein [Deltaproteobacteria bacterium]|nr:DUF4254 domain-containing protein [Deltaproteobacteria bacterium]
MAETLGSLADKLTIANIRLWHLEDKRRNRSLADEERLAAADAVAVVNSQRNALIDELDRFLEEALAGRVKLSQPKMKLY